MEAPPFDAYRDSFLRFVENGMSCDEALSEFDEAKFHKAAVAELDAKLVRVVTFEESHQRAGDWITNDERKLPALIDLWVRAQIERRNSVHGKDYHQALELWQAGWTSESVRPDSQVMSWYWRAPSRRPGKLGRKYLSTNQAHKALKKASA